MGEQAAGRIGPNAILQFLPVLEAALGREGRDAVLGAAGVDAVPDGTAMVDEDSVRRLHQCVRRRVPGEAATLSRAAGRATADYIIANRIPAPAAWLLPRLPARFAEALLVRAVEGHAWTFAGSGAFRVVSRSPLTVAIAANPMVRGETAPAPVCAWHAGVFQRLFGRLVAAPYHVEETACGACGAPACIFVLRREPRRQH